jgi:hypothetical protein
LAAAVTLYDLNEIVIYKNYLREGDIYVKRPIERGYRLEEIGKMLEFCGSLQYRMEDLSYTLTQISSFGGGASNMILLDNYPSEETRHLDNSPNEHD